MVTQLQPPRSASQETWQGFFGEAYLRFSQFILTPDRTAREVAGIQTCLPQVSGLRVLDLGCGQGRIAVPLAQAGHSVVGVDGSPVMLAAAHRAAAAAGVNLELIEGDLRALQWENAFDAVLSVGTALGYAAEAGDDAAILRNAARALKPGGTLIVDTENRERTLRTFQPRMWVEFGGTVVCSERGFDPRTSRWRERLFWDDGTGKQIAVLDIRLYTATELVGMLTAVGFEVDGLRGSLEGGTYGLDAPRLVVLAHKSAPSTPPADP